MLQPILRTIAVGLLLTIQPFTVNAMDEKPHDHSAVDISAAYTFATSAKQKNGAIFMTLTSADGQSHKLISADTPAAERTELHTHLMEDGMMMMREVEHYDINADAPTTLKPMGHHIMLFNLKEPLAMDTTIPLTLSFDDEQTQTIDVPVIKPGTKP